MILYFTDRMFTVLGFASTSLYSKFVVVEDKKLEDAETGIGTLEFKIAFKDDTRLALEKMVKVGNCVLRNESAEKIGDGQYTIDSSHDFFTITETEIDAHNKTIYAYAEDAGLDLINDLAPARSYSAASSIETYVNDVVAAAGFKVRTNEFDGENKKLSWDVETTAAERLQDIAESFGCDLAFGFEVQGLTVTGKYIDILDSNGNETDVILYMERDISNITVTESIENIATALHPTGADDLTLSGYSYDDGDFYVNGEFLFSREAFKTWQRDLLDSTASGDVYKAFSCNATTKLQLCNLAIAELKKLREPAVNYEVEIRRFLEPVNIRDRINIVDDKGELYLSAKVLQLETSVSLGNRTAVLGDYLIRGSGVSDKVLELSNRFSELSKSRYVWIAYAEDSSGKGISTEPDGKAYMGTAYGQKSETVDISDPSIFKWVKTQGEDGKKGEDAAVLRIDSSRGTVFKNNAVTTVLSVTVYYGSQRITNITDLRAAFGSGAYLEWKWQKVNEESFGTILSTDSRLSNDGFTFSLTPADVDTKVTFLCNLIV